MLFSFLFFWWRRPFNQTMMMDHWFVDVIVDLDGYPKMTSKHVTSNGNDVCT